MSIRDKLSKYNKGDFGTSVFLDLDFAIRRLVTGLASEDLELKEGYFLAFVYVLKAFL